jgi:hypothetical protein
MLSAGFHDVPAGAAIVTSLEMFAPRPPAIEVYRAYPGDPAYLGDSGEGRSLGAWTRSPGS